MMTAVLMLAAATCLSPVCLGQQSPALATADTAETLHGELQPLLADYRMIIVLMADEAALTEPERKAARTVGQVLFHDKLLRQQNLAARLDAVAVSGGAGRFATLEQLLDDIESNPDYYDADRLAFRELLVQLQGSVLRDSSLPAIRLHKRIGEDLAALTEIELRYNREITQIFSSFDSRAIVQKRERWDDYVAHLKALYSREQLMKDYGTIVPYSAEQLPAQDSEKEIFGYKLPPKTVALSFDDGPHPQYTDEILAVLKQYSIPAVFFEVGRNVGSVDAQGNAQLGSNAAISRRLLDAGHTLANHSYSHAMLAKETGDPLKAEIGNTDLLLRAVDARRAPLFRFPYGAHNDEGLQLLDAAHLRSVMWNVDSLDWADPVPSSVADRVLRGVDKEGRGIILFHDIHQTSVKALPLILDRLVAEGYRFAGWDGTGFSAKEEPSAIAAPVTTGYADSWALVIGINDYAHWPRLQYASNDAQAMRKTLIERFGFAAERVLLLENGDATRNGILAAFHDRLAHGAVQKNDRVLVFFAGHGATRRLSSGRDIGYIIPADADPAETARDAIPMTEIQNIAEGFVAKHVFFIMDACYSGLGLARGGGGFVRENAKRIGRQMLTAGGADQMVADGGPDGHSIFTWTLLQGLNGKGDLNGDSLITATELAAYVAPAVASVSLQTPAFGSLPGSEGGDFVFALPADTEYLSAGTVQLSGDAIALNDKLDAAGPEVTPRAPGQTLAVAPVKVKDLQGKPQTLGPAPAVNLSARQLAQRANDRGLQHYKEKRYAEAEAEFTEALKLRPGFALATNNLGFVYYKQEQYAEAARWFENTVKLDPSRAVAYLNLGDAYARSGQAGPAQKAYRTYLELAPQGPSAAYVRQQLGS